MFKWHLEAMHGVTDNNRLSAPSGIAPPVWSAATPTHQNAARPTLGAPTAGPIRHPRKTRSLILGSVAVVVIALIAVVVMAGSAGKSAMSVAQLRQRYNAFALPADSNIQGDIAAYNAATTANNNAYTSDLTATDTALSAQETAEQGEAASILAMPWTGALKADATVLASDLTTDASLNGSAAAQTDISGLNSELTEEQTAAAQVDASMATLDAALQDTAESSLSGTSAS
jgi:hypothetical protein